MKDSAVYCEHPGGVEMAYIPYWRHRQLMHNQKRIVRRLSLALVLMIVVAAISIVKGLI